MLLRTRGGAYVNFEIRGGGRSILFLHPAGLSGRFWDEQILALADRYQVLTLDFRGHGASEMPSVPFSLTDLAEDVLDILTLTQASPAAIVGLSLGGMVAQVLAARHPEVVSALVLADTLSRVDAPVAAALEGRAQKTLESGMTGVLNDTLERWFSPDFLRYAPSTVSVTRSMLLAANPVVHAWTWRAIKEMNTDEALPALRIPTLVVVGEKDVSTPPAVAAQLAAKIPDAELDVVPGAGHISVTEQPVWFLARLERFLQTA